MSTQGTWINGNLYYDYPSSSTDTTSQDTSGTTNQSSTGRTITGWTTNLPNYSGLSSAASNVALSNLSGVVPADVQNQISQAAAERGISQGSYGNANTSAELLRALGLTSTNLTTLGEQQYNTLLQNSPRTTTTDTSSSSSGRTTGSTSGSTTSDLSFEQASALNSLLATGYGATSGTNAATGATGGTAGSRSNSAGVSPPITGGGSGSSITQPTASTSFGNAGGGNFGGTGSLTMDTSGQFWVQQADGTWRNTTTGEVRANPPANANTLASGLNQSDLTDEDAYSNWWDSVGDTAGDDYSHWYDSVGDTGAGTGGDYYGGGDAYSNYYDSVGDTTDEYIWP